MELEQKIEHFISELEQKIEENLPKVGSQFLNHYDWPEFDPLREEISRCLLCDYCQAAITLTNHLLENFLKTMLVYKDSNPDNSDRDLRSMFKEGLDKYSDKDLNYTISRAKTLRIITKEQAKHLKQFKDDFRNPYSHADKKKIFKDLNVNTQLVKMNKDLEFDVDDQKEFPLENLLFAQGIAQSMISKKIAFNYFIVVDDIIRVSLTKYLNE